MHAILQEEKKPEWRIDREKEADRKKEKSLVQEYKQQESQELAEAHKKQNINW